MFGMEWASRGDSMIRPLIITAIWCLIIIPPMLLLVYFVVDKPQEDHWAKVVADDKLKTQQEHDKVTSMNCKELGDWLLQDNVWSHDNLIWAQNHYLVNCK